MKHTLILGALLAGCTTVGPTKHFRGPDGSWHYETVCYEGFAGCYEYAAKLCKGPYEVVNNSEQNDGYYNANGVMVASTTTRLVYKCRQKASVTKK